MAAVDPNSADDSNPSQPADVFGDRGDLSEVDTWLGSSSFVAQQPESEPSQELAAAGPPSMTRSAPRGRHKLPRAGGGSIDDPKWAIWFHFQDRESVVRNLYQSDISFRSLLSFIRSEGCCYDYMFYVSDDNKGIEGLEKISSEDDVQKMLLHSLSEKIVNIRVVKANEPSNADESTYNYFVDNCINTQQSCTKLVDTSMDRKEELKKSIVQRQADLNHFEGDTDVSEFLSDSDGNNVELQAVSSSDDEDRPMAQKLKAVRNPGPNIRSHNEVEKKVKPDWLPEADEKCYPGDYGISDEEDEPEGAYKLPSGRKRRNMKLKERVWFDAKLPDPEEQFFKGLCFTSVYEFRDALRDFHIRTLRNFQYHRNAPDRIIVWCLEREPKDVTFISLRAIRSVDLSLRSSLRTTCTGCIKFHVLHLLRQVEATPLTFTPLSSSTSRIHYPHVGSVRADGVTTT